MEVGTNAWEHRPVALRDSHARVPRPEGYFSSYEEAWSGSLASYSRVTAPETDEPPSAPRSNTLGQEAAFLCVDEACRNHEKRGNASYARGLEELEPTATTATSPLVAMHVAMNIFGALPPPSRRRVPFSLFFFLSSGLMMFLDVCV